MNNRIHDTAIFIVAGGKKMIPNLNKKKASIDFSKFPYWKYIKNVRPTKTLKEC